MKNRVRLTPARVRAFACQPHAEQSFLWDEQSPRLAVRATAGGARAYIFESKLNRQTIRRTIGSASAWALDDARAEANRLQTLIDRGIDPRELDRDEAERKAAAVAAKVAAVAAAQAEAEAREKYTLRNLAEAYVRHLETRRKAKGAADARSAFKVHLYPHALADKPAREVAPVDVAALVRKVAEAGKTRTAGILRSYLNAAFTAARRAPLSAELPAELIAFGVEHNPVEVVPTIAVNRRDRVLSDEELRAYLKALGDAMPDTALRLALLAGGQRMAQLLRARVADWDEHTSTLRLLDGKGKRTTPREHLLPLAPKAAAIVETLVARAVKTDPEGTGPRHLFGVPGAACMAKETPGKRLAEICADMKCPPFDLRDVRRTSETRLAALGVTRDVRAQLLSHGISGVQAAHYDRHAYVDEKRAALVAWEARLDEIESGPKKAKVLPIRAGKRRAKQNG